MMHTMMKKHNFIPRKLRSLLGLSIAVILSGCGTIPHFDDPHYVTPLSGAAVTPNTTNYTQSLDCLGGYLKREKLPPVRLAVGRVDDFSGKQDLVNGRRITQGTALMVISAISRTHLPIVERLDVSTAEMEFKYTDNKLIGDVSASPENTIRRTFAGSVVGSDYHVIGGITEVNYNIRSGSLDSTIKRVGASGRYAVLNIAIDLRLVNTKTLEVANVVSFQKQIIGTEIRAGVFSFLSDSVVDISASDKAQEPIQQAVRMVAERAVYELISDLYKVPAGVCNADTNKPDMNKSDAVKRIGKNYKI
jgi:holdfast attachment protein HfaB